MHIQRPDSSYKLQALRQTNLARTKEHSLDTEQAKTPASHLVVQLGTPEKENCASLSAAKDQGGQAARKLGHAVTGDLAVSSRQMFLRTTQEEPGHCQE
jgi:hypothetical protein